MAEQPRATPWNCRVSIVINQAWNALSTHPNPGGAIASLVLHAQGTVWLLGSRGHGISSPTGDIRNDLYLTLEKGDFERGGKSVQKNIEVTMYVLYADGEILKVRLASQFGTEADPEIALLFCGRCPGPSGRTGLGSSVCVLLASSFAREP